MKITTMLSYAGGFRESAAQVAEFEKAGLDLVWVAEAYGFDSPSLMGYLAALTEHVGIGAAILPIYTRTPTLIAMTARVSTHFRAAVSSSGSGRPVRRSSKGFMVCPMSPPWAAPERSSRFVAM